MKKPKEKRPARNNSLAYKVRFSVNLEEDLADKLNAIAFTRDQSRSSLVNDLLSALLQADREELHAVQNHALEALLKAQERKTK